MQDRLASGQPIIMWTREQSGIVTWCQWEGEEKPLKSRHYNVGTVGGSLHYNVRSVPVDEGWQGSIIMRIREQSGIVTW
jgi:hypothetical protein